jgi:TolA-binding protein
VAALLNEQFVPVKVNIKENPKGFERFGVQWTPTLVVADGDGTERYRFEGYMPPEEFLAHVALGLANSAFARSNWDEAEQRFRKLLERHSDSDVAPEALYWAGVSRYKATGDAKALAETEQAFRSRYTDSLWAKKASVWAPAAA